MRVSWSTRPRGRRSARCADCTPSARWTQAVAAARAALPGLERPDTRRAGPGAAAPRGPRRAARGRDHPRRGGGIGQARGHDARRRAAVRGRQPALLRGRGPVARGHRRGRPLRGLHLDAHPSARRASWAAIAPWNFPFIMAVWKLGAALAAGNTRGHQAFIADPALDAPAGPAVPRGRRAAGRRSTWSPAAPRWARRIVTHPGVDMVSVTGPRRPGGGSCEVPYRASSG